MYRFGGLTAALTALALLQATPAMADAIDHGVNAEPAWAEGYTGHGTTVAVLDTGADAKAPWFSETVVSEACFGVDERGFLPACSDLLGQLSFGPLFGRGTAIPPLDYRFDLPGLRHGHLAAGIAVGAAEWADGNPVGRRGIAPDADLVAINAASVPVRGKAIGIIYGAAPLRWLYDNRVALGLSVVNLSGNGEDWVRNKHCDADARINPVFRKEVELVDLFEQAGIPVVVAAGNKPVEELGFPGCLSKVIAVGGTNEGAATMYKNSNRSSALDVLAPAVGVEGPDIFDGSIRSATGTSFAAPIVSGAIALYKQQNPFASVADIRKRLRNTGRLVRVRKGLNRRLIDVAELLNIPEPLGAVHGGCIQTRLVEPPNRRGYRVASLKLTCAPSDGRPDRLLLLVDAGERGFSQATTFRNIPIQDDAYYRSNNVVFSGAAFRPKVGKVHRICWLLFGSGDTVWPAQTACEYEEF